jgi:Ca2+-binding EF-hand superfamily protein
MIERMDENEDGLIQADEMKPRGGDRGERNMERMFERMDTDEDGTLSAEEFAAAQEKMQERGERRQGQGHSQGHGNNDN